MQRIPFLWTHASVLRKVGPVGLHDEITKHAPRENVVSVGTARADGHKDHHESLDRASPELPDDLLVTFELDLTEASDIAELP